MYIRHVRNSRRVYVNSNNHNDDVSNDGDNYYDHIVIWPSGRRGTLHTRTKHANAIDDDDDVTWTKGRCGDRDAVLLNRV